MSMFWLATRATGEMSLVLLTLVTVLGVATTKGWAHARWPEAVVTLLHRNLSLLSIVFLVVHIATTVLDGYVPIGWIDVVVPFGTTYRTVWVAFGTIAIDLLVAVIVTSLLRGRIAPRVWRVVHWAAYALWASAVVHALGVGTDVLLTRVIAGLCVAVVGATVVARVLSPHRSDEPVVSVSQTARTGARR